MKRKAVLMVALALVFAGLGALGGFLIGRSDRGKTPDSSTKQLWTCSMHPQVLQDKPGACPICGMQLTPVRKDPQAKGSTSELSAERKVKYWWDPMMNPPYVSNKPGKSPMGMDLVPVYEDEVRAGPTVTIDPIVTQNIGVRVATVEEGPLTLAIRTVGFLREAETRRHDITLKVEGWIERLYANTEGMLVRKGEPLFELYSPDILVAQEELLLAQRALERLPADTEERLRTDTQRLIESARQKLVLWDVPNEAIDEVLRAGKASGRVTFRSPADGYVVEKMVVQGAAVERRMKLLRIVDQSELWIDAQLYESQLPYVMTGQKGRALIRGQSGAGLEGRVVFVSPQVDSMTRTAVARIAIPNADLKVRPGQFATVEFPVEVSLRALLVPREAVIDTGVRQIALVALDGGHFEPRHVQVGAEAGDGRVQILAGLAPGERVVTSGQFLLDSESRMREAIQKMTGDTLLQPPPKAEHKHATPSSKAPAGVKSDPVISAYLQLANELSKDRAVTPTAVSAFAGAARELAGVAGDAKPAVEAVVHAAELLQDKPLKIQRETFKKLSEALIELTRVIAPTNALGPKLYVLHCPMAEARWIQNSEDITNPYYGSEMLECGSVSATIETVRP